MSGTGLFACQLAKNVFHAGKVITTVSTSKIPQVKELLGENTVDESKCLNTPLLRQKLMVFEVIDYTKSDPGKVIQTGSVDFLFDTVGSSMEFLNLMKPQSGCIISVATMPSGTQLQDSSMMDLPHKPTIPFAFKTALNLMDCVRKLRARRYGVEYSYMFLASTGQDLDELRTYVEEGRLRTVVGTTAQFSDLKAVQDACQIVYSGKGGLGKVVLKIAQV